MENIFKANQRLAILATHLSKICLEKHPKRGQYDYVPLCNMTQGVVMHYEVKIHSWIFQDLHILFPESWYYNVKLRAPMLKGMNESENPIAGIFDFFLLTPEEFTFLWDISGFQNTRVYGGKIILEFTEIKEIASNITSFIRWRMSQIHPN